MKLKYVGARPIISKSGVCFDETKPDNYIFLTPIIDILDALESINNRDKEVVDIVDMKIHHFHKNELIDSIGKYCKNLDELFEKREERANKRIDIFIEDSKKYRNLTIDEESALLGNIKIMRNYYLHYVLNETLYHNLLHKLADKMHELNIKTLLFPIGVNHALVLSHLVPILEEYRPSYNSTITMEEDNGEMVGRLELKIVG